MGRDIDNEILCNMIGLLEGSKHPLKRKDIEEHFAGYASERYDLNEKTYQRYLIEYMNLYGIELEGDKIKGYSLPARKKIRNYDELFCEFLTYIIGKKVIKNIVSELLSVDKPIHLLSTIKNAISYRKPISYTYVHESKKYPSNKYELYPYDIVYRGERWYVVGYVPPHVSVIRDPQSRVRIFLLSNIRDIRLRTGESFDVRKEYNKEEFFKDALFVFKSSERTKTVKIRFDKDAAEKVRKLYAAIFKNITVNKDGSITVEASSSSYLEARDFVLKFIGSAELLEPKEWRVKLVEDLKKSMKTHI
jgi:hypothetical protein